MKKIAAIVFIAGMLAALSVGSPVQSQPVNKTVAIDFLWEQPAADTAPGSDLAGWKLYRGEVAGGPYSPLSTINYSGTAQDTYTTTQTMDSPAGQVKTWYFVLTAFDKSGNETTYSNEAAARIDFQPPSVPTTFRVTIRVMPQ